jgi:hypothetical protein
MAEPVELMPYKQWAKRGGKAQKEQGSIESF